MNPKIDIFVNGNSLESINIKAKELGYVPKKYKGKVISPIDQFIILYKSIKQNWTFYNNIYFIHSLTLSDIDKRRLAKFNVIVLYRPSLSKHSALMHTSREHSYIEDIDCDYRLILDADMIALKDPIFDLTKDAQASFEVNAWNSLEWGNICKICECDLPTKLVAKENRKNSSYVKFYENKNIKRFPYFNNGAVLIKNNISKTVGNIFVEYRDVLRATNPHYAAQIAIGLAISNTTDNWGVLPRGFNYLATLEDYVKYNVSDITLYHYLGANGNKRLDRYDKYFKGTI